MVDLEKFSTIICDGQDSVRSQDSIVKAFKDLLPGYLEKFSSLMPGEKLPPADPWLNELIETGRRITAEYLEEGLQLSDLLDNISILRDALMDGELISGNEEVSSILHFFDRFIWVVTKEWLWRGKIGLRQRHQNVKRHLVQEQRRYLAVFREMTEAAFVVDEKLSLVEVNPAFEKLFGIENRDCRGKSCCEIIGDEFCTECPVQNIVKEGGAFTDVRVKVKRPGMDEKYIRLAGTALGGAQSTGRVAIVIAQDVTERVIAREALRRSESQYRTMVESLPDVIWRADVEGNLIFVSPNASRILGVSPEQMIGSNRFEMVHPDDTDEVRRAYKLLFEEGELYDIRYRFVLGDGSWLWVQDRADSITESEGSRVAGGLCWDVSELKNIEEELDEYRSWLEDMVDERTEELSRINTRLIKEVSERKRIEKELILMAASLQRSNAELEQFAYVASHDLKEPLMLITAFAERLRHRYVKILDEKGIGFLERMIRAAGQLQELVDALLELSKVTTSAVTFHELDLSELVREVIEDLEELIERTGARIDIGSLNVLNGDEVQIRQLFQNIISNALKYSREGVSPSVCISSRIMADGQTCEIMVEDNGIGFEETDIDKIFEPFSRLHSREEYDGCGMGLTTCRKIAVRHGGMITARGRPGDGATFIIQLPLKHI